MHTIRKAVKEDLEAILQILNYEILHATAIYDYEEKSLADLQQWYADKVKKEIPLIVAEEAGEILGYATYDRFRPKEAYRKSVEHSVYLSQKARGRGLGSILLKEIIQRAREQGHHSMIAGIDADNHVSIHLHSKTGFKEVGRMKEVGYKFDRWLDLVFMQLIL
ncbi:N-acetyltransferase family protein [Fulvivirga maritima]|uniref:GNAT family N-acetyltransferase n=1 Tax=Fulvivirga maritima TaxID=2904247 RepID=UPI001F2AE96D|nr:GNAT family N-acetyltransferase [Fulvivirga maritima]UII24975.1 N-acetyltransferase family protein [Fulvivirga maritima]